MFLLDRVFPDRLHCPQMPSLFPNAVQISPELCGPTVLFPVVEESLILLVPMPYYQEILVNLTLSACPTVLHSSVEPTGPEAVCRRSSYGRQSGEELWQFRTQVAVLRNHSTHFPLVQNHSSKVR